MVRPNPGRARHLAYRQEARPTPRSLRGEGLLSEGETRLTGATGSRDPGWAAGERLSLRAES
jgi:hypothetical protein